MDDPARVSERPRRRWPRLVLVAPALACAAACGAWAIAGTAWPIDVAASFTFQSAVGAGVVAAVSAAARARSATALALVAVALGVVGQVRGRSLLPGRAATGPALRVLVFNSHSLNEDRDACFALIERADADVVVLVEPEIEFSRSIRWDGALNEAYPVWIRRDWVRHTVSPIIVLSRLPLREIESSSPPEEARFLIAAEVESAIGPVVIAAGQPRSPRSAARWESGNEEAERLAGWAGDLLERGRPVVLCADLNSTPAAHRGSIIRRAGLRPAKPLLAPTGTFPASLPWPARIALDDAWHSPELAVASWRTIGHAGSDHEAVLVEFVASE